MTKQRFYVTTAIPYVNGRPHLGFALEIVQADALARHWRQRGAPVRFLTGTDDNSLKNVQAAEAEGVPVRDLVDRNAAAYAALRDPLGLSFDDFIRTSSDPRHPAGVERLWRACQASGDLYRKLYQGLYCVGCEQFFTPAELEDGRCPEHGTEPRLVTEENWFFRLSRHQGRLAELIESGTLRIEPASRRNEVLGFIAGGLEDFSVSRSVARSRGWGIGVPDDPDQVIYVWFDALANYLTALGYGTDAPAYHQWWASGDRRVHVIGKGILRFQSIRRNYQSTGDRQVRTGNSSTVLRPVATSMKSTGGAISARTAAVCARPSAGTSGGRSRARWRSSRCTVASRMPMLATSSRRSIASPK